MLTFTPTDNLKYPINLTFCFSIFLDCGRKLEYAARTHADTRRTCSVKDLGGNKGQKWNIILHKNKNSVCLLFQFGGGALTGKQT